MTWSHNVARTERGVLADVLDTIVSEFRVGSLHDVKVIRARARRAVLVAYEMTLVAMEQLYVASRRRAYERLRVATAADLVREATAELTLIPIEDAEERVAALAKKGSWAAAASFIAEKAEANVVQVLQRGLAAGRTPAQIESDMEQTIGKGRDWENLVRTEVQRVNNAAIADSAAQNADLVSALQFLATMDTRTCVRCAALDGQVYPLGEEPQPPIHPRCRCTLSPIVKDAASLERDAGVVVSPELVKELDGQASDRVSYDQWLGAMDEDTQRRALGQQRFELYKAGVPIKSFVDSSGSPLSPSALGALKGLAPTREVPVSSVLDHERDAAVTTTSKPIEGDCVVKCAFSPPVVPEVVAIATGKATLAAEAHATGMLSYGQAKADVEDAMHLVQKTMLEPATYKAQIGKVYAAKDKLLKDLIAKAEAKVKAAERAVAAGEPKASTSEAILDARLTVQHLHADRPDLYADLIARLDKLKKPSAYALALAIAEFKISEVEAAIVAGELGKASLLTMADSAREALYKAKGAAETTGSWPPEIVNLEQRLKKAYDLLESKKAKEKKPATVMDKTQLEAPTQRAKTVEEWENRLTYKEQSAIVSWTGKGYIRMRKLEREGKVGSRALYSAMDKAPLYHGTVYRGIRVTPSDPKFVEYTRVGAELKLNQTSSWSKNRDVAVGFSTRDGIVFKVNTSRGVDITTMSTFQREKEVLSYRNARYRVTSARRAELETGVYRTLVELEEIDVEGLREAIDIKADVLRYIDTGKAPSWMNKAIETEIRTGKKPKELVQFMSLASKIGHGGCPAARGATRAASPSRGGRYGDAKEWKKSLTYEQREAFKSWAASDDFRKIRKYQMTGTGGGKKMSDALESACATAPLYKGVVYRGLAIRPGSADWKRLTREGGTLKMKAMASWSKDEDIAQGFTGDEGLVLKVRTSKGIDIQKLSPYGSEEKEVVSMRNSSYRVRRVRTKGDFTVVELEEL